MNAATELAKAHAELGVLAGRIAELAPGAERTALVVELSELLLTHAEAEQHHLFPALRIFVPGGWDQAADQGRRQRAIERTIRALARMRRAEGDEYDILVGHLVIGIEDHVRRQDSVVLPDLVDSCPIDEINVLGRRLSDAAERALEAKQARAAAAAPDPALIRQPAPLPAGFRAVLRLLRGA